MLTLFESIYTYNVNRSVNVLDECVIKSCRKLIQKTLGNKSNIDVICYWIGAENKESFLLCVSIIITGSPKCRSDEVKCVTGGGCGTPCDLESQCSDASDEINCNSCKFPKVFHLNKDVLSDHLCSFNLTQYPGKHISSNTYFCFLAGVLIRM